MSRYGRRWVLLSLVAGVQVACGEPASPPAGEGSSTGGEATAATTGGPTTGAVPTTSGATESATENSTAADAASEAGFSVDLDGSPVACDLFAQDCPEGSTCINWLVLPSGSGVCMQSCTVHTDCRAGYVCFNGFCVY